MLFKVGLDFSFITSFVITQVSIPVLVGVEYIISNDIATIEQASSLIFPGVGAFPMGMANLKKTTLDKVLIKKLVEGNTPFLGICLGMQLLFEESDEQILTKGLGLLKGKVTRIGNNPGYPVPHVGWDEVTITRNNLFKDSMIFFATLAGDLSL